MPDMKSISTRVQGRTVRVSIMDALDEAILGLSGFDSSKIPPAKVAFARGHVCVENRDPKQAWSDRLREIDSRARDAAALIDCDPAEVRRAMLKSDGWVINKYAVKTPHWMPHMEIPMKRASSLVGLGWLSESID